METSWPIIDATIREVPDDRGLPVRSEFAREIYALAGIDARVTAVTSEEYGAAALRPAYSVLGRGACDTLGLPPLREWRDALAAYLEERRTRKP